MLDLDAVQARANIALHPESDNPHVIEENWYQSAKDVPDLVAELRAAQELAKHVLDFLDELDLDDEDLIDDSKSLRAKATKLTGWKVPQ